MNKTGEKMPSKARRGYRTCSACGKEIPKEEAIDLRGKIYCAECAKPESKAAEDYKKLSNYLYGLSGGDKAIFGFLLSQVRRLKNMEECDYKDSGILATLKYVFEISGNPPPFNPVYGIESLVIKNYYWARKYHEQKRELSKQDPDMIDQIIQTSENEIHIDQNIIEHQREVFANRQKDKIYGAIIDLDSIEDEEEDDDEEI